MAFGKKSKNNEKIEGKKLEPPLPQVRSKTEEEITKEVEKYQDVEGLSTKKLNFGLWFVENRQMFIKLLDVFLVFVGVFTWSYTIYGFGFYLIKGMKEDRILANQLVNSGSINHEYLVQIGAKDLIFSPVNVILGSANKYDFAVKAQNINEDWYAEFDYYFLVNNEEMGKGHSFLLPQDEKYIIALGQEFSTKPSNIQFMLENFSWTRINKHIYPNWRDFSDSHLDILVDEVKFTPASRNQLSNKISFNEVSFTTINKSAYNYWQVDYKIAMLSGNNLISINQVNVKEFMSGEERDVLVRWPGIVGSVSRVEIKPELDITKDNIYIKYQGEIEE